MCGITGIFAFNSVGRINLVHLEQATRSLESRGPDYQDSWFDNRIGLGHRRLSVIDTSPAGNQPMQDSTGRYRIVFNGEIYNFRLLRKELADKGYFFRSESDTEVLIQAFICWGKDAVKKLNGFFAFAIYDAQKESLFIARDRYGIKPLYIYHDDDKFIFASGLRSVLSYGIPRQINLEALNLYFQLTYIPSPYSIIEGVKKLEPGQYMTIDLDEIETENYYELPYSVHPKQTNNDLTRKQLVTTLRQAVHDRLVADVPLGAFLSGGIDSSIIVALASEEVQDFKTFSIGFKDNKYFDETRYANLVADKFKTDHRVFSLTNQDLLEEVDQAIKHIDEPFADSSALPVYILSKQTRKHVTVALSGDGADELFSGYNKHSAWLMSLQKTGLNSLIKNLHPLWRSLPKSRNNSITDSFRKLDRFASIQSLGLKDRYWFLASFTHQDQVSQLLKQDYRARHSEISRDQFLDQIKTGDLNEVLASDMKMVLQGDMLTKVDMMSMANGLEVRVPFLDARVVRLAFDMPTTFKAKGSERKIVLREAFRDHLPPELYTRPKHGFEVPLLDWFRKELKSELNETVFNRELVEEQGIFDWKEITRIKSRLLSFDPGDTHILVWSLYVFQCWYKNYFKV